MEQLLNKLIYEYKYDSEEERNNHVELMGKQGFEVSDQVRRSDDSLMKDNREYYWFAHFWKYR
jgi:hypothetical protein